MLSMPPDGIDVTVYPVMAEPPSLAGAVKFTVAVVLPAVAVPIVGAPGGPVGVTLLDAAEAGPVPMPLVAVTVKVYAVALVRPVTLIELHGEEQVPVKPPGLEVAV